MQLFCMNRLGARESFEKIKKRKKEKEKVEGGREKRKGKKK